jgi:ABC-type antimicrobial peptide transport system permease subunit
MASGGGDDASCLNLNQVSQPALLGVNGRYLDSISAFTFVNLDPGLNANHPWLALDIPTGGNLIPGYADQTVIQWGLRKKVGDTLFFLDEASKTLMIKLMGGLDNSIFQGNLLVSENLLRKYYPSAGGSKVMLVDAPLDKREEIGALLENSFIDHGLVITAASERLALFNSVQNTYLSVFMLLGGLGVIIGTVGFGLFIIRNIMGRQVELATYLALGFRRKDILRMVFLENLIILVSGIVLGSISALVAILPSFLSPAFQFPGLFILVLLLAVFLSGLLWIILSVNLSVKEEVVKVLRKE